MNAADIAVRAEFARQIAREAGVLAGRYFRREIDFAAETKGPQDFVSVADHAVEALLRSRLQSAFATDAVLGEEGGGELGRNLWVIDPIDGTINFVHGVRYWCISIGFIATGERQLGVIYDPTQEELFWATRGGGRVVRHHAPARCATRPARSLRSSARGTCRGIRSTRTWH